MDVLGSGCSSGCESGWTVYLDQSFICPGRDTTLYAREYKGKQSEDDDEEEDLSMVSDASSGPPLFHGDQSYFNQGNRCFYPPSDAASLGNKCGKRQKMKEQELPSFLDDTASSSVFNYKNNHNEAASMEGHSQGFSSNFEDSSAFQQHYTFLQPSGSANQTSKYPVVRRKEDENEIKMNKS